MQQPRTAHEQDEPAGRGHGYVDLAGRRFYRIVGYDRLEPFFMTVVGSSDVWLFASSTGGLTAGRVSPESALFPYYTDDKVAEGAGRTGGLTLIRPTGAAAVPWEPFAPHAAGHERGERTLYKDVTGTALVFEEARADLGLRLRVTWETSDRFGVVRTCELTNLADAPIDLDLLDGFVNVLPAGVGMASQNRLSNLLDAYKRNEVDPGTGLGIYWLSSRLTDLAEPSESLQANVAWQVGLADVTHLASVLQLPEARRGDPLRGEHDVRGRRGAYLLSTTLRLEPGGTRTWHVVGDVDLDAAAVADLRTALADPDRLGGLLREDLRSSREALVRIVASADGLQTTGDELASAHHLANVLFNVMRGGIPADGYRVQAADVRAFLAERSSRTARRAADLLDALPAQLGIGELRARARATGDADLIRLVQEYLPLMFSRRHGDPSRPWNLFRIELRDEHGAPTLSFQGNWRDIFQNWEALSWSFPEFLESMITVFLDATTADGYNPYRIARSGIDWEIPDPDDPWSNIGYWSDHQIVYLLRLLETSARFHPGRLAELRDVAVFTHADVPYRIAPYEQILADPYSTIGFDAERQARIEARVRDEGGDGRLVHGSDGDLVRVTLADKLLLLLLAKLVNLVPDGGIWMNTQRPEWNDANNALVGRGLSVVTLAQLRPFVEHLRGLLTADVHVSAELAELAAAISSALQSHEADLAGGFSAHGRRALMDRLGAAGSAYRESVYAGLSGRYAAMSADQVQGLLATAASYIDASLRANRRPDDLFHSYNILELGPDGAGVRHLPEMLEGQVAVLSSGLLDPQQSLDLLRALRASALYRADQHSYLLYPDKDLPGFLDRNSFPASRAAGCPLVEVLVTAGDRSLVVRDGAGNLHFAAPIRNVRDVEAALERMSQRPALVEAVASSRDELLAIFEEVFTHAEFTGRSGTFFGYEGLGSIYWHMVSKLLLAVQETIGRAVAAGAPRDVVAALEDAYADIRAGLGYCKDPEVYGAFPTDPYSHTPAGAGARQPGMTGQVKEEVLTRLGELGVEVADGRLILRPQHLRPEEWTDAATDFHLVDVEGRAQTIPLPPESLGLTFCQVPLVYHRAAQLEVDAHLSDGRVVACPGGRLPGDLSAAIFQRLGTVARVEVRTPGGRSRADRAGDGSGGTS